MPHSTDIKNLAARQAYPVEVKTKLPAPDSLCSLNLSINQDQVIPEHRPSLIIHTTGTSGAAKSVVQTRRLFSRKFPPSSPNDRILVYENLNWMSANITLIVRILTGSQGDVLPPYPGPAVIWERLRKGGITKYLDRSPAGEREEYVRGANTIERPYVAGSAPAAWVIPFWKDTFDRDIQAGYIATELDVITLLTTPGTGYIERCLGKPLPGITAKLSNGDHGEIRIKTPYIFSHYLNNPAATEAAFDEEGFFKTGDAGHLKGDQYVFDGRLGADFLDLDFDSVPMLNLDMQLLKESYIMEAYGISLELGNELGVLVRFEQSSDESEAGLMGRLREDVARIIAPHRAEIRIRVLRDDEFAPHTVTRKIWRRKAIGPFFPEGI